MKKLIYITLAVFFVSLTSCEEEKKSVIEGTFLKDCTGAPIEPTTLKIYGTKSAFMQTIDDEFVAEITTNEKGSFRFEYDYVKNFDGYKFYDNTTVFLLLGYDKNLKFTAYNNATVKHNVKLLVNRPFTNQDTLIFGAVADGTVFTLNGPFVNNQIIPIFITPNIGFTGGSGNKYLSTDVSKGEFVWGLGAEEYNRVRFLSPTVVPLNIILGPHQSVCGQGGEVVVDLRNK